MGCGSSKTVTPAEQGPNKDDSDRNNASKYSLDSHAQGAAVSVGRADGAGKNGEGNTSPCSDDPETLVSEAAQQGARSVLELMDERSEEMEVQRYACESLAELCAGNEDNQAAMYVDNGILKVLAAMKLFQWEPTLQQAAIGLLGTLAASYAEYLGKQGAVEAVLQGLRTCKDDYQVQLHATRALQTLFANRTNQIRAAGARGLEIVDEAAEMHPQDGQLQWRFQTIRTQLESLSEEDMEEANRLSVSRTSPWAKLREAVFMGRAMELSRGTIPGLHGVSGQVAQRVREGIDSLMTYMVERSQSYETQYWCFDALATLLAGDQPARERVHANQGIQKIIFGMHRFRWVPEVQANACKALTALAADYPTEIGDLGGIEEVLNGMIACSTDYQVQTRGTQCLSALMREPPLVDKARSAGAVSVIRDALDANPEDGQLQWRGMNLLEVLEPGAGQPVRQKAIERAESNAMMRSHSRIMDGEGNEGRRNDNVEAAQAALAEVEEGAEAVEDEDTDDEGGKKDAAPTGGEETKEE